MGFLFTLLMLLGLATVSPGTAKAQGFAGLGAADEGFAKVVRDHEIAFPRDHGPHPLFRIEWWYLTANLEDAAGQPLGLQFTLFRNALRPGEDEGGWQSNQFWMAHAAVTTAETHLHAERLARGGTGQAGAEAAPFRAWIDDWAMASTGEGFSPLSLSAGGEGFSYDLTLTAEGPMVLQGEEGFSVKSAEGSASYYVSQPFFRIEGTVILGGEAREVSGRAWMDREWSSAPLQEEQEGWDWFALHLGTGERVMIGRVRHERGLDWYAANWISPEGVSEPISGEEIELEALGHAEVDGRRVPVEWAIRIPSRGLDVTTRPLNPKAWNATLFSYWEGPIFASGSHEGVGYLEMTGYGETAGN